MDLREKQRLVVDALEDIKGRDILVYNTARMPSMFERVVIASGDSTRQVKALADNVQRKVRESGARVYGVEGEANGEWVLVDLGDIVVHIMHPTVRDFYNLEEVWGGKSVTVTTAAARAAKKKPAAKKRPAAKKPAAKRRARGKASPPRRKR
jgi:ribosome-associated protein